MMAQSPTGGRTADDRPYLAVRLDHRLGAGSDDQRSSTVASILTRPCFADVRRVACEQETGHRVHRGAMSPEVVIAALRDPECEALVVDSGHGGELVAHARIMTGVNVDTDGVYPAPLWSNLVLPHDPALTDARIDAFCALAASRGTVAGFVSLEPSFELADSLSQGQGPPRPLERALEQPGMTEQRVRERSAHFKVLRTLDRRIAGPEWGLFLSHGHLTEIRPGPSHGSGPFARVTALDDSLAFLQLTRDPLDTLRVDYDHLLDRARAVLRSILWAAA